MSILFAIEIIGTIAFAISGAIVAIQKKLDLFGVIFLSIITATGGGIFRDVFIGNIPPTSFKDPTYCVISIVTAVIVFYAYPRFLGGLCRNEKGVCIVGKSRLVMLVSDAMGLGIFTAIGANAAIVNFESNIFIVISMALFTGVGGGMVRDAFVQNIPVVFTREIYAVATIIGATVFYIVNLVLGDTTVAIYSTFIVTFLTRVISVKYDLHLPRVNQEIRGC